MTPVARWVRFNKDGTQASGNGWFQHSVGTWELNSKNKTLSIINTNGFEDQNSPFYVAIENDQMTWDRIEEGQSVTVSLKKENKLPQSPGDALLGIWSLEKVVEEEKDVTSMHDSREIQSLFFRWDKKFVIRKSPGGTFSGVYNVHGHKNEVELIFYGDDCKREQWAFEFEKEGLTLRSVGVNKRMVKSYIRGK